MIRKIVGNFLAWLLPLRYEKIYLICTILLVVSIPLSPFLLSVSQFALLATWLIERDFKKKVKLVFQRKSVLVIISLFVMHLIWLLNSHNIAYAIHDLKIKLPLLALPLIYGTIPAFSSKQINLILKFFISAIIVGSIYSLLIFLGLTKIDPIDYRYVSGIISHIRFALLIVLSLVIILHLIVTDKTNLRTNVILITCFAWLILFLVILGSLTGIILLTFLFPLGLIYFSPKLRNRILEWSLIGIALCFILIANLFIIKSVTRYQQKEFVDFEKLEKYTVNGNKYHHYPEETAYENGFRVWVNISNYELRKEWNRISDIAFDSTDKKGQHIQFTLVRYLSSLGYKKDSVAISKLSKADIEMIENGQTNYLNKKRLALYPKIYEILWEIDEYKKTGNPSGHSITQRIEYLKTGFTIIKKNLLFGVGNGDVEDVYQEQYRIDKSPLSQEWRRRAHNQFITFTISFGLIGLIWFLIILIYPVYYERKNADLLFWGFYLIALLSMLNEDTLETQAGVTFYAFFLSIFLLARKTTIDR